MEKHFLRGNIFVADLRGGKGSEVSGIRPVLIVQNNIGNEHAETVIIAPMTTNPQKPSLPTHYKATTECGLTQDSTVEFEHIRAVDKKRFGKFIGSLDEEKMKETDNALAISVGLK